MSVFYYCITKKQLPPKVIERAHSIFYSLNDITRHVKDAKKGYWYYDCDPVSIYTSSTRVAETEKKLAFRCAQENNYLLWLAVEFYKLGCFQFIRILEDNTKCGTGYFEAFFKKCGHSRINYMDFCWCLASNERGLDDDILYLVH